MNGDPAFGSQPATFTPPPVPQDISAQYDTGVNNYLNSKNPFQNTVGESAAQEANQIATGQLGTAAAYGQYDVNQAETNIGNIYNNQMAGYQLGQLGINQQQLGIQGTGLQEQGVLTGVEQPIQTSQLVGSEAASGALNTKGSIQNQQQLGAQQQYTNEQLQNAQQQLALLSKSNGMSQQELYNQMGYQTAQGQIQGYENPIQLLNSIAQIQEGGLTGEENVIGPAGLSAGTNYFPGQSGIQNAQLGTAF